MDCTLPQKSFNLQSIMRLKCSRQPLLRFPVSYPQPLTVPAGVKWPLILVGGVGGSGGDGDSEVFSYLCTKWWSDLFLLCACLQSMGVYLDSQSKQKRCVKCGHCVLKVGLGFRELLDNSLILPFTVVFDEAWIID